MGYSYGRNERGNTVLACDNCGNVGGVRKRECPHTVLGDSLRTASGQRHEMAYCPAPAVCGTCWTELGGNAGVHPDCEAGAAASQAHYDAIERELDAGELYVTSAAGDWHDTVPAGMVRVTFSGRRGTGPVELLVPAGDYDPRSKPRLSDYQARHEYSSEPDTKYAHLVRGRCSCGWATAGYMAGWLTVRKHDEHVAAVSVAA